MKSAYVILPIALLYVIATFTACKKTLSSAPGTNSASDPLIPESSGWKRVWAIENSNGFIDQNAPCDMTPYDLVLTPSGAQILYSENKYENGDRFSFVLKATCASGTLKPAPNYIKTFHNLDEKANMSSEGLVNRPYFIGGTFTAEDANLYTNTSSQFGTLWLWNEANTRIATNDRSSIPGILNTLVSLPNGDLLGGGVNLSQLCELNYYTRATNTWSYGSSSLGTDTSFAITYTPFKLDDGSLLAFRLYSKGPRAFMSVDDFVPSATFAEQPFIPRATEEHPEYAPNGLANNGIWPVFPGTASVCAYTTEGSSVTVVLAYQDNTTKAYTLSAFKWTKGVVAFQKLYSGVAISTALGDRLINHRVEVGCKIDGTAYALLLGNNSYSLVLANAAGEKSYGTASNNNGGKYVASISCLHYYNGAYYAVAWPFFGGADYMGQHMDIIKLVP
jgi:hypothetical protein